jgi:tetratricopeptide (TPR) repeat protein
MLLALAAAAPLFVTQPPARPPAAPTSPYLEVVRSYGPGTEREAVAALQALAIGRADRVFDELDDRVCRAYGARSCDPSHLIAAGPDVRGRVGTAWRRLYPRALGLHVQTLLATNPFTRKEDAGLHVAVLLRMAKRFEAIAAEPDVPDTFAQLGAQARRLLVWSMQYLRWRDGLMAGLDALRSAAREDDVDLRLARAMLDEMHAGSEAFATSDPADDPTSRRDRILTQVAKGAVEVAVRRYEAILQDHPALLEAHLRLARLLARLERFDEAERHLSRAAGLQPDARQAYLIALFAADVFERRGQPKEAIAAYGVARQRWPPAQTPGIGLARLHAVAGHVADAHAALASLPAERTDDALRRSDPWLGYVGGHAWRLPDALAALGASFEAEP